MAYADSLGAGRAITILGDHWNLRILLGAFLGVARFNDWQRDLGISASVLTQRLQSLVAEGLLEVVPRKGDGTGSTYRLAPAGEGIWTTLVGLWLWDERWARDAPSVGRFRLRHEDCGAQCRPVTACSACDGIDLTARDTEVRMRSRTFHEPDVEGEEPPKYRRPAKSIALLTASTGVMRSADLLGDRWSALVLSAAFLGCHRFSEFETMLAPIPPPTLSTRLATFVEAGVLEKAEVERAPGYRLTVKGHDFFPVLVSITNWGATWTRAGSATEVIHRHCGRTLVLRMICNACRQPLDHRNVAFEPLDAAH